MRKKIMFCLIALAFICTSMLLMTSCAKKQVKVSQAPTKPSAVTKEKTDAEKAKEAAEREARQREARQREIEKAQRLAKEILAFESENIYFDFDKSELKPEAKDNLKEKADWLNKNSSYSVRIDGHCDERGTQEYNLALGERRAYAAKNFLVALGISGDRISTVSYGEEKPADPGHDEEAWAKNRRDEFKLTK